jgi:hypothetical protein
MKKIVFSCLVLAILVAVAVSAHGQTADGRPDPTGQGRYTIFGDESLYEHAHVVSKLPADLQCNPAGELVGSQVLNSTREGHANLVVLTDKATVANASDGRIFLCHCAKGFNQLFLVTEGQKPAPAPAPNSQAAVPSSVGDTTTTINSNNTTTTNYATGGMPAAAVYEYVNGCAVASISMGIRIELPVPICPSVYVGGGYYPSNYDRYHREREQRERGGNGGYQGGGHQQPVRPVHNPPTTPVGGGCTLNSPTPCDNTGSADVRKAAAAAKTVAKANASAAKSVARTNATAVRTSGSTAATSRGYSGGATRANVSASRGYSGGGGHGGGHR